MTHSCCCLLSLTFTTRSLVFTTDCPPAESVTCPHGGQVISTAQPLCLLRQASHVAKGYVKLRYSQVTPCQHKLCCPLVFARSLRNPLISPCFQPSPNPYFTSLSPFLTRVSTGRDPKRRNADLCAHRRSLSQNTSATGFGECTHTQHKHTTQPHTTHNTHKCRLELAHRSEFSSTHPFTDSLAHSHSGAI